MGNLNPKKKNLYKGRCLWPGRMWSFNILLSDTFSEFLQQNEHFNGLLPTIIRIFWIVFKSFYLTRKYSQIHICIYKYVLISNDLICIILIEKIFYDEKIQDPITLELTVIDRCHDCVLHICQVEVILGGRVVVFYMMVLTFPPPTSYPSLIPHL